MAKFYSPKISVSSGEITPLLAARTDLAAYKNGARTLTNGIVLPQGGFCNRPGTTLITPGGISYARRLIPFIVNTNIAYVLAFCSQGQIYVVNKAGQSFLVNGTHNFYTSFTDDTILQEMTYVQSADVMILCHKLRPPMILKRLSDTNWTVENFITKFGPYEDMNSDPNITITVAGTPSNATITSSSATREDGSPFFQNDDVGTLFYVEFYAPAVSFLLDIEDGGEWDRRPLYGNISMTTEGDWQGEITLSRQGVDDEDFVAISDFTAGEITNNTYPVWAYTGTEDELSAIYKLEATVTKASPNYTGVRVRVEASGGIASYNFRISSVIDSTHAIVVLDNPGLIEEIWSPTTPVSTFAFASFGKQNGYPGVCTLHQERLVLANSRAEPTTIWMSKPANWENFDTTIPTEDSDSIKITLATNQVNEIRAMTSKEDLLIFTAGAEFVAQTGSQSDVFTPSSLVIVPTGYRGSAFIEVLNVGSIAMFVQKHGNVIRSMGYQLDTDGYNTSELSVLSEHLFEGKTVKRWCYQQDPWSIIWFTMSDGTILSFTFVQEHQVAGWSKHTFPWKMYDVCSIPGDGQDDVYFLSVPNVTSPTANVYLLNHREDRDGLWSGETYADSNQNYVTTFESLEMEQEQAQGTVQGRFKQIAKVCIRLFRTAGLKAGIMTENSSQIDQVIFPDESGDNYEDSPPAYWDSGRSYTGDAYVSVPGDKGRMGRIKIVNDNRSPITVLGVWEEVTMEDDA